MKSLVLMMVLVLGTCLAGSCFAQSAGIDGQSRGLFHDVLSNTTDPGVVHGARRGEIFGGSFVARNPIVNISVASWEPPHITAGCGGINAFMGSFSFISKAQLVSALRSIATAAVGYAFRLALKSMCPSCESVMSNLQAMMNQMTGNGINSCRVAQSILNMGGDNSMAAHISHSAEGAGRSMGFYSDWFQSLGQGQPNTPVKKVQDNDANAAHELGMGNLVWTALKKNGANVWATNSGNAGLLDANQFLEDLQSLTGTIVICTNDDSNCGPVDNSGHVGRQGKLITHIWKPTLDLKALIAGSRTGKSVTRLTCTGAHKHDLYGCTNIKLKEDPKFIGIQDMVLQMMLGYSGAAAHGSTSTVKIPSATSNGLIDDIVAGKAPTQAEMAFIQYGGPNVQMAVHLAMYSGDAAKQFVVLYSKQIAADMAMHLVGSDLDITLTAVNQNLKTSIDLHPVRDMIHRAYAKNLKEKAAIDREAASSNAVMQYYQAVLASIEPKLRPFAPQGP